MKLLLEFLPILFFFIAYKWAGIYVATGVAIGISFTQSAYALIKHRRIEPLTLITLIMMIVLGGSTLLFHNEIFIKWKPTAVEWALACTFMLAPFFTEKPLSERMLGRELTLRPQLWRRLDFSWATFFIAMGAANLFVATHYDTNTWVNFKLFGMFGATLAFVILQALYLSRQTVGKTSKTIITQESDAS